tara:strand:- start:3653 stop:4297 length:645 start_codon:yes stop_codon:yes gene_type:complete
MPHFQYKVVKPGKSKIATALHNIKEITLVVKSGMVLNIKDKDLPKIKNLMKYDMCVSRQGVYTDHPSIKKHYKLTTNELHKGMIDLSLFIMNPFKWYRIPAKDQGILSNIKKLVMPRYMNHRDDPVFAEQAINCSDALTYGVLGEQACVYNYIDILNTKQISVLETYAYCLDKLLPYTEGLPKKEKEIVEHVGNLTKKRISRMRRKLHNIKFIT